jgi:hypothetical protein
VTTLVFEKLLYFVWETTAYGVAIPQESLAVDGSLSLHQSINMKQESSL